MAVDEVLSASQGFHDQELQARRSPPLPRLPLPDEDKALSIDTSAAPLLPKRRSYYISSAERDGKLWGDWGREGEILNIRPVKKSRRALWWQFASNSKEGPTARRRDNTICFSLCEVGARRKVMNYARNLFGGLSLKSIDWKEFAKTVALA